MFSVGRQLCKRLLAFLIHFFLQSDVLFFHYCISRDPEVWRDADKFIPERFDRANTSPTAPERQFISIPFGFGTRGCIGTSLIVWVQLLLKSIWCSSKLVKFCKISLNTTYNCNVCLLILAGKRIAEMELSMSLIKVSLAIITNATLYAKIVVFALFTYWIRIFANRITCYYWM